MNKKEILEWKKDRINLLNKYIRISKEDIQRYEKEIEMLNDLVTKEGIENFERNFFQLSKEERTNTEISGMLKKIE